jgi:hypothetical protein
MFFNPLKIAVQKYMSELLKERTGNHIQIIERMCAYLVTETDVRQFGALIADVYQMGYTKAAQDYVKKLAEQGYQVNDEPKKTDDDQTESK